MKTELMRKLNVEISSLGVTQVEVSSKLGITQPRLSNLRNMKEDKFSIDYLLDLFRKLGKEVTFTISNCEESKNAQ